MTLVVILPTLAFASPYQQLVVFGDSLSDSGQFPDPGSPLSGGLPTGGLRFTNRTGPTFQANNTEFIDTISLQRLAARLGLQALPSTPLLPQALTGNPDGSDYAVGGYETASVRASIMDKNGSVVAIPTVLGALERRRDGYLIDNPQVSPNTLFYVNGGGNNVLDGVIVDANSAAQSASQLVAGVAALQRAGARYILVPNLPEVGSTPVGFFTGERAAWNQASAQYNSALDSQLDALGGNVIRLNLRDLLNEIKAAPATYGFDPAIAQSDVCFDGSGGTCHEDPTWGLKSATPDPRRLLFNDGEHPTAALQQISADYIYALLSAPWEISQLPEMGRAALRDQLRELNSELQLQQGDWQMPGWRISVTGGYRRPDLQDSGLTTPGANRDISLNLSASHRFAEHWLGGLSLGLGDDRQQLGSEQSQYKMRAALLTAFVRYQRSLFFNDWHASAGYLDFDQLDRRFALGTALREEQGTTKGWLWGIGSRMGLSLFGDSFVHAGPFIGSDYQRVRVNGYQENSGSASALAYDAQTRESLLMAAGFYCNLDLGQRTRLFAEAAREHEFKDGPESLGMGLVSLPDNRFQLQGVGVPSDQTRVTLGLAHQFAHGPMLSASYNYLGVENKQQGVNLGVAWDL